MINRELSKPEDERKASIKGLPNVESMSVSEFIRLMKHTRRRSHSLPSLMQYIPSLRRVQTVEDDDEVGADDLKLSDDDEVRGGGNPESEEDEGSGSSGSSSSPKSDRSVSPPLSSRRFFHPLPIKSAPNSFSPTNSQSQQRILPPRSLSPPVSPRIGRRKQIRHSNFASAPNSPRGSVTMDGELPRLKKSVSSPPITNHQRKRSSFSFPFSLRSGSFSSLNVGGRLSRRSSSNSRGGAAHHGRSASQNVSVTPNIDLQPFSGLHPPPSSSSSSSSLNRKDSLDDGKDSLDDDDDESDDEDVEEVDGKEEEDDELKVKKKNIVRSSGRNILKFAKSLRKTARADSFGDEDDEVVEMDDEKEEETDSKQKKKKVVRSSRRNILKFGKSNNHARTRVKPVSVQLVS